jgi:hypothetical protein
VQLLLGHTKIESTVRYLGIEVDDTIAIAEQVDVGSTGQSGHSLPTSLSGFVPTAEVAADGSAKGLQDRKIKLLRSILSRFRAVGHRRASKDGDAAPCGR